MLKKVAGIFPAIFLRRAAQGCRHVQAECMRSRKTPVVSRATIQWFVHHFY